MTLQELQLKVVNEDFTFLDFQKYYSKISQEFSEFKKILEDACSLKKEDKELRTLLQRVSGQNASELMEKLKKLGYALRKSNNSKLKDAFTNMGYRLLEQTRAGKREEVYYGLLRIFVAAKENFRLELVEAFKPHYSDEMFKVFIFTFLSGIIGEEQNFNKEN